MVQVDGKDHVRHIKRFAYQIVALDVDSLEKEAEVESAQLEEAVQ